MNSSKVAIKQLPPVSPVRIAKNHIFKVMSGTAILKNVAIKLFTQFIIGENPEHLMVCACRSSSILHIKQFAPCCCHSLDNRELNYMAGVNDLKGMYYETF